MQISEGFWTEAVDGDGMEKEKEKEGLLTELYGHVPILCLSPLRLHNLSPAKGSGKLCPILLVLHSGRQLLWICWSHSDVIRLVAII